jgi:hypothetical protein
MITLATVEAVVYTCTFLLPGFLINGIIGYLVPRDNSNNVKYILSCLAYSISNFAVWSWLYFLIWDDLNITGRQWLPFILLTILLSALFAVILGVIQQKRLVKIIAIKYNKQKFVNAHKKFKIKVFDPAPTAWDYVFAELNPYWVAVTQTDNKEICGKYSTKSFVGSAKNDMFLERTCSNVEGKWIEDVDNEGVYIPSTMIKSIKFIRGETKGEEKDEQ